MATILHQIVEKNNFDYLQILFENGSDVNTVDNDGNSLLHHSINSNCDIKIFKLLLDKGASPNIKNNNGMTAFHIACMNKNKNEFIKLLLEYEADPKLTDKNDRSCLYYAIENCKCDNDIECIKLLLKKNVDFYNGLNSNYSPFWNLLRSISNFEFNKYQEILLEELLKDNNIIFDVQFYIQNEKLLINHTYLGEPIYKTVNCETTPFIWALENNKEKIAEKLIQRNVNLTFKGGLSNASALEIACLKNYNSIIKMIVKKLNKVEDEKEKLDEKLKKDNDDKKNNQYDIVV